MALPPGDELRIVSFSARPSTVARGGRCTLSWTVEGAARCRLSPGSVQLPDAASGTLQVTVEKTTSYTLTAEGAGERVEAVTEVRVMPVEIRAFAAVPDHVARGEDVTLSWETAYAGACSIDQGVGDVPMRGSMVVRPERSVVYTLSAGGLQPQTRALTVRVSGND